MTIRNGGEITYGLDSNGRGICGDGTGQHQYTLYRFSKLAFVHIEDSYLTPTNEIQEINPKWLRLLLTPCQGGKVWWTVISENSIEFEGTRQESDRGVAL